MPSTRPSVRSFITIASFVSLSLLQLSFFLEYLIDPQETDYLTFQTFTSTDYCILCFNYSLSSTHSISLYSHSLLPFFTSLSESQHFLLLLIQSNKFDHDSSNFIFNLISIPFYFYFILYFFLKASQFTARSFQMRISL